MKVTLISTIYNESIAELERLLFTTKDFRKESIVMYHTKLPIWTKRFIKKNFDKVVERDMNKEYPCEKNRIPLINIIKTQWLLVLDPDEFLDNETIEAIKAMKEDVDMEGYWLARANVAYWVNNKLETWNYPDPQLRLFKSKYNYSGRVHFLPSVPRNKTGRLPGMIIHDYLLRLPDEHNRREKLFERSIVEWEKGK